MRLLISSSFLCAGILTLLISCEGDKKKKPTATKKSKDADSVKNGVVKSYFEDNKLRTEISYKDGKKEGLAKEYYSSGTIFQEIEYKGGIKEGVAKRYHENGKLYQNTYYVKGFRQGKQQKFRDDGRLASEATYSQDEPCLGLIEYTTSGEKRKKFPSIVITPVDKLLESNKYILKISMSDKAKAVEYYVGDLTSGCLGANVEKIWPGPKNGVADLEYYVPRGAFIMETINVIAKVKTLQGNFYLTQRSYNVAAENN